MAWVNRKRVKGHIHHFRVMNNTFISDKMAENARSNVFDASKCLSEAYRKLNLAYCMSLSDSSFGPEGQKRELLDIRKRASVRGTQQLFSVK